MLASPEHASGWGAFTLGVSDVTPVEMANVFATLAAEGTYCQPLPVQTIRFGTSLAMVHIGGEVVVAERRGAAKAVPHCKASRSPD